MPSQNVKYAMGLGRPDEIVRCVEMGYDLFDCVIPTREARHHRLYVYKSNDLLNMNLLDNNFYTYLYIMDEKYISDKSPISDVCDCFCCKNYSKSYLRHLFVINDPLSLRLATIHNLRFFTTLMERLRGSRYEY